MSKLNPGDKRLAAATYLINQGLRLKGLQELDKAAINGLADEKTCFEMIDRLEDDFGGGCLMAFPRALMVEAHMIESGEIDEAESVEYPEFVATYKR